MAAYNKSLVDIPEGEGVHIKLAGAKGEKYVYKYVKYFRNADGNPRNKAKAIGKFDIASGKMFPNGNYFDLYNIDPAMPDIDVWDYGYSYLVLKICQDIGLFDCLAGAFGRQRAMDIVVMASYIIREGSAMDGIDDWQSRNYFPKYNRLMTSQSTSKIFAAISAGHMNEFFINWVKIAMGEGAVCYDVTSISSYAQQMPAVERGYNRDCENLAQFNLGMFCDESSKTPVYYNRYNGSLTDKTNLSYVLANAEAVGIKSVKMVVDGGFMDKGCLASLCGLCSAFIVGLPTHLKESQNILASHGGSVENYANALNVPHTFCISVDCEIQGVSGKALLYFDALSHVLLCNELSEKINRLKAELSALKRYPNDMDGNRIRTHNEQTTDGKVFVTFVACVIRSYLLGKLSQYLMDNSTSLKKVLSQLSNITIVSGAKGLRFTKALSKKHKQILKPFAADTAILDSLK